MILLVLEVVSMSPDVELDVGVDHLALLVTSWTRDVLARHYLNLRIYIDRLIDRLIDQCNTIL